MPAPSPLSKAIAVVHRLVNEESTYHKEAEQQKSRISKLESANGDEYEIRQEKQALEETYKVIPTFHSKISEAVAKLEAQIEQGKGEESNADEIAKAQEAVAAGKKAVRDTAHATDRE